MLVVLLAGNYIEDIFHLLSTIYEDLLINNCELIIFRYSRDLDDFEAMGSSMKSSQMSSGNEIEKGSIDGLINPDLHFMKNSTADSGDVELLTELE